MCRMQAAGLLTLLLFLGANWTTIYLIIAERHPNTSEAADILGFSSLDPLVNAMLVLLGVLLLAFAIGVILAFRSATRVQKIQLAETRTPPELTVTMGLTWHLFNSHIWSTGQDAVAVI